MMPGNAESDDSMDGGGRATQEAKAECVCFHSGLDATMPHGRSLQRGAPTVGAIGDNAWMKTGTLWISHFQVSRACKITRIKT
jgi:hypothetical protein